MYIVLLIARILHIGLGVFWVGAMLMNTYWLMPAVNDAGPDGAKVAAGLMRRGFMTVMPLAGILTIVSGLYLYWFASGGFEPAYMNSRRGMTYALGAIAAIIALALGLSVIRPSMGRAATLSQAAAGAAEADRARMMAEAQSLRARAGGMSRTVAWLLIAATLTMAVGRYI